MTTGRINQVATLIATPAPARSSPKWVESDGGRPSFALVKALLELFCGVFHSAHVAIRIPEHNQLPWPFAAKKAHKEHIHGNMSPPGLPKERETRTKPTSSI